MGCKGECFNILLGRSSRDFLGVVRYSFGELVVVVGTAGAMEKRAALKVATRMDLEPPFGWTAAELVLGFGVCDLDMDDLTSFLTISLGSERRRMGHRRRL